MIYSVEGIITASIFLSLLCITVKIPAEWLVVGYSLQTKPPTTTTIPPLHLKTIVSFILCLAKKENSICVSITLRELVMIATKWLLSHRGGGDKEDERSVGAAPIQIIGMFVCVCHGEMREDDTPVESWQLVGGGCLFSCVSQSDHCGSICSMQMYFYDILTIFMS